MGRARVRSMVAAALALSLPVAASAGTTGKIQGRVIDRAKQPLVAANVSVPLARTGAVTDADGRYQILNVPAGTYEIKVSLIGYRGVAMQDVVVSADQTATVDLILEEAPVEVQEIVVSARRPVVDVSLTSTLASLDRKEIQALPVQELQDVVNLQAGVVDGHFRGGRAGEVQYQVDGVTVNNSYDNTSVLRLDRSLLEEVQVISGTFDAEYGQAMSGVVNAVLRRGTEQFRWDGEILIGGYAYQGGDKRRTEYQSTLGPFDLGTSAFNAPGLHQNYQISLSGPLGLPQTYFLINGRRYLVDDYLEAEHRYTTTMGDVPDSLEDEISPEVWKVTHPDGDGSHEPLGYSKEWSGVLKLTQRSIKNTELNYQAVVNQIKRRDSNWAYRLNPDGISRKETFSISHGLDVTHTLSRTMFLSANLRQNYFNYEDMLYDDLYDGRYDQAGPGIGISAYEYGANVQGVEFNRFTQKTNSIVAKGTLTSQLSRHQQVKVGGEFEWPTLEFGTPGHLLYSAGSGIQRVENLPPYYPAVQTYHPRSASGFAQSAGEWNDLNLRVGLRLDCFNPMTTLPSDLANPANTIEGAPPSPLVPTTRKFTLSPRLAVSYPVTRDAALFFAYGHFIQMPGLGQIYTNADYQMLQNIQASSTSYDIMGNPDIKPEKTVQYQFGYRQALTDWFGVEANVFYKDVRDLLGVEFIATYNDAEYARWTNVDYGTVVGTTISLDQRQRGPFSWALDYTWQRAYGNSSDPRETATRAEAGEDPRPRNVPFNWDQRHTLNLTLGFSDPRLFLGTMVFRAASGQPYTPNTETGFGTGSQTNSGRKPSSLVIDLRGERPLLIGGRSLSLFGRVFNLFDSRFLNSGTYGTVFSTSGSPYYSRFPEVDRVPLHDPTRFYPPRRIELGLTFTSERPRVVAAKP